MVKKPRAKPQRRPWSVIINACVMKTVESRLVYTTMSPSVAREERRLQTGDDGLRDAIVWALFGRGRNHPSGDAVRRDAAPELARRISNNNTFLR